MVKIVFLGVSPLLADVLGTRIGRVERMKTDFFSALQNKLDYLSKQAQAFCEAE